MSKLAVASSTVSYGGTSRIPRRFAKSQTALPSIASKSSTMDNGTAPKKKSRLEQMQANFQLQILKDKEEKMINLYQESQQRALQRVNQNRGFAREFFEERRNSPGSQHSPQNPSLQHTYTVKKNEYNQKAFGYQGANNSKQIHNNRIANGPVAKTSAGRDRSNPLAPIQRTNSGQSNTSSHFPTRAKIVRPRTFTGSNKQNSNERGYVPKSAPNGTPGFDRLSDGSSDDTPPPNAKQLQALQQRRKVLQNQQNNKPNQTRPKSKEGKLTDFQRWQQEQEKNRELRLQKQRERIGVIRSPPEDEGYEEEEDARQSTDVSEQQNTAEIKRKQQELLAQIEQQQQELDRLRRAREEEAIEESRQQERRAKLEKERRRQMEEAERERRIQEEEEEERHRREMEAARARKAELERQKQKSRPPPKHQYEYEDSDPEDIPAPYQTKAPAPPSGPKPANRRAPPQQRQVKNSPPPARDDSPPLGTVGGSHLALYEGALQDSDAYGNTGKLKACYNCGRKFAVDRLGKHEKACKIATKKRKVMDPTKLRTAGTEMEQYVKRMPDNPKSKKNSNWRAQHKSFMDAIKYAKKVKQIEESGGNLAELPPPPRSENPDYVQCPHCTRRFNPSAAERHIPHCKNARSRPAPLKRR